MQTNIRFYLLLCPLFFLSCAASDDNVNFTVDGEGDATYKVTLSASWSSQTHPDNFPANAHFSGLIGAMHNHNIIFWQQGQLATSGIESMAETGKKNLLISEINGSISVGDSDKIISGGGLNTSPSSIEFTVPVKTDYTFLTLVTMLAPSPDWFIGVSALNLMENGVWLESLELDLYAYDAGTDDGLTYTSGNADTQPQQPVYQIMDSPFLVSQQLVPIARLTIIRLQ